MALRSIFSQSKIGLVNAVGRLSLVFVLGVSASCESSESAGLNTAQPSASSNAPAPASGTIDTQSTTLSTSPQDCDTRTIDQYDGHPTVHTIADNIAPVTVVFALPVQQVCAGDTITVDLRFRRTRSDVSTFDARTIYLTAQEAPGAGCCGHWPVGSTPTVTFDGDIVDTQVTIHLPTAPPGTYRLEVAMLNGAATIELAGPSARICPPECAQGDKSSSTT